MILAANYTSSCCRLTDIERHSIKARLRTRFISFARVGNRYSSPRGPSIAVLGHVDILLLAAGPLQASR